MYYNERLQFVFSANVQEFMKTSFVIMGYCVWTCGQKQVCRQ